MKLALFNSSERMAGRNTSVTDRVPVVSSSYHQKCIASSMKATKEAVAQISRDKSGAHPAKTYTNCNKVAHDQLWKDVVRKELKISKEWYGVYIRLFVGYKLSIKYMLLI